MNAGLRSTMLVTMNFDRRIMAGAQAAQFFAELCRNIESMELPEVEDVAS